ncbi:MAG TPA: lysophospholipid acyltransferase family protein [Bauldia sp.]|nr:lysophospholipid acyltransferase family protein [Bauldia sp.]
MNLITSVRSTLFKIALYGFGLLMSITLAPGFLLLPERQVTNLVRFWGRATVFLLRVVAGTKVEVRGAEHIPTGPALIAAKHQSMIETFALLPLLPFPTYVMKAELKKVPFFGLYTITSGMIHVERDKGPTALRGLVARAREELAKGRQIIIFPEGTRRPAGAPPEYQTGVALLYKALDIPVVPVARHSSRQYPGTVVVEFLPPIPAGLDSRTFLATLETSIETASDRLLVEADRAPQKPPFSDEARARVVELEAK